METDMQSRGFHPSESGRRTISVAGKTIRGNWVYGAHLLHGKLTLSPADTLKNRLDNYIDVILQDGFSDWNMPRPIEVIPVVGETVGLLYDKTDKNGNSIYVGDVVKLVTEDGEEITIVCQFGSIKRQIFEHVVDITGFYFVRSNDGRNTFPIVENYLGKHDSEIWEVVGTVFDVVNEPIAGATT